MLFCLCEIDGATCVLHSNSAVTLGLLMDRRGLVYPLSVYGLLMDLTVPESLVCFLGGSMK